MPLPRAAPMLSNATGDLPMARVKMNAKHEYEFLANYKVLQVFFKQKKIDKVSLILLSVLHPQMLIVDSKN